MDEKLAAVCDATIALHDSLIVAGLDIEKPLIVRLEAKDFMRLESMLMRQISHFHQPEIKSDGHLRSLMIAGIRYEAVFKKTKILPGGRIIPAP